MNKTLAHAHRLVRFGVFEVDLHAGELRKSGARLNLQQQPLQLLSVLLERPGEIVSREELHSRLWADDTFVDFDHGLNTAVKRLRDTLGDTADSPRFVETVPRRGYRFIAPTSVSDGGATNSDVAASRVRVVPRAGRSWLLLAASLFTTAIVGVSVYVATHHVTTVDPFTVTAFTTFSGQEVAPTFSRDGTQIAFAWSAEGLEDRFELYVKAIGSERRLQLTHHPADFIFPAWSPQGDLIAFARMTREGSGIYTVSPLGGPERKLADAFQNYYMATAISWSHDGKLIAFADNNRISIMDVTTLERHEWRGTSKDCLMYWAPTFSPDGKWLSVGCVVSYGVTDLILQPAPGGPTQRIATIQGGELSGMAWTADSRYVLFTQDGDLWRAEVTSGRPEKLVAGRGIALPAVSRDGSRLAYTTGDTNTNIWAVTLADSTRSAGPPARVISSTRMQQRPAFAPDGRRVAFESTRSGPEEIWTSDADGSNAVALTTLGSVTGSPKWSPHGEFIAFDSRAGGTSKVYIISSDGGRLRPLTTGLNDSSEPEWSIDGQWIYFAATVEGCERLFRVPAGGGKAVPLTVGCGSTPRVASFDGRIYYTTGSEIWSVSIAGHDERPLDGMPRFQAEFSETWALSATGVYFLDADPSRAGINFFEFRTGRINRVMDLTGRPAPYAGALAFSGNRLLYPQIDGISSDIMLLNLR